MDLIYCNEHMTDIGVLQNYEIDMAYGSDENDFELKLPLEYAKEKSGVRALDYNDYIYIERTEYGGIVDAKEVLLGDEIIKYKGRTWTGLLKSKVIEPPVGQTHRVYFGEANAVLAQMLSDAGLSDVFRASTNDSGITISEFEVRFNDVYESMIDMLSAIESKLKMAYMPSARRCVLWAEQAVNYSALDYFDSSIVQMNIGRVRNRCNHLICLGGGQGIQRHVIHLFTDSNGGVRPYLHDMTKEATEDSDYIIDKSMQVLFGKDEYAEVYDYSNVEAEESYKVLTSKPADWDTNYVRYYEKSGNDYSEIMEETEEVYQLVSERPADWSTSFTDFFKKEIDPISGNANYIRYSGTKERTNYTELNYEPSDWDERYSNYYTDTSGTRVETIDRYTLLDSKPSDWKKHHTEYYTWTGTDYTSVPSASKDKYIVQTRRPSDWNVNWESYYMQEKGKYKQIRETAYYTQKRKTPALYGPPTWKKNTYYNKSSESIPPSFSGLGDVYKKTSKVPSFSSIPHVYTAETVMRPSWNDGPFYKQMPSERIPIRFTSGTYYEQVFDNYAELVEGGLDRLKELNEVDSLDVDFGETEQEFDIGDIVGATDDITGVAISQMVAKKIVTINSEERGVLNVRYEV